MRFCKEAMAVFGSIRFPDNEHKGQMENYARSFDTGQDHVKQMRMAYFISKSCELGGFVKANMRKGA